VSGDEDSLIEPKVANSRRVSARVAIPVVLGCAVLGSIIGVAHPLGPPTPNPHSVEESGGLRLASARLVEEAPAAVQPKPSTDLPAQPDAGHAAPESQAVAPPAIASVSTGSVDRSSSPGASESRVLDASQRAARSERTARLLSRSRQIARAKRLRRILWRRPRSKPPGSDVDAFFTSLSKL
jgi:hypothetical protein